MTQWANRKLSSIHRKDIHTLHTRIGKQKGSYAANRLLALISKLFNLARSWGFTGDNPAQGVEKFREHKRERFLQPDELPRFFEALVEEPNDAVRDYVLLSLFTGARKQNVLSMRWEEVHWERMVWIIPGEKSKNFDPMEIPLHNEATVLLRKRREGSDSPWVFPGTGEKGYLADPKKGWHRILERAGIENLRLHDLRRTLGSWQAAAGANLSVIGKSLGHKNVATTAIYARLNIDPVRDSVNTAVDNILVTAGVKVPAEIIPLQIKRKEE